MAVQPYRFFQSFWWAVFAASLGFHALVILVAEQLYQAQNELNLNLNLTAPIPIEVVAQPIETPTASPALPSTVAPTPRPTLTPAAIPKTSQPTIVTQPASPLPASPLPTSPAIDRPTNRVPNPSPGNSSSNSSSNSPSTSPNASPSSPAPVAPAPTPVPTQSPAPVVPTPRPSPSPSPTNSPGSASSPITSPPSPSLSPSPIAPSPSPITPPVLSPPPPVSEPIAPPKPSQISVQLRSSGEGILRDIPDVWAKPLQAQQTFKVDVSPCVLTTNAQALLGQPIRLLLTLSEKGQVEQVTVSPPVDQGDYDRLAICLIKTWEFQPAFSKGQPVASNLFVQLTVTAKP